jgi:hypothetical protein
VTGPVAGALRWGLAGTLLALAAAQGGTGVARAQAVGPRTAAASTPVPTPAAVPAPERPAAQGLAMPELPPRRDPIGAAAGAAPDADGGHLRRDAERRRYDPPLGAHRRAAPVTPDDPSDLARPGLDPVDAEALRRQGEREQAARRLRGGLAPPPEPTPPIRSAPPLPAMPAPPRIALPSGPGQPGGPPVALPTCGPAGCFDAGGRPLGGGGGDVLFTPDGRPCIRMGASASC